MVSVIQGITNTFNNVINDGFNAVSNAFNGIFHPNGSSSVAATVSGNSFKATKGDLDETERAIIGTISNKLQQTTSGLHGAINNQANKIQSNISKQSLFTRQAVNRSEFRVRQDIKSAYTGINNSLGLLSNNVRSDIQRSTKHLANFVDNSSNRIEKRLFQLSQQISSADRTEVQTQKIIARELFRTLNDLFADMPDEISSRLVEQMELNNEVLERQFDSVVQAIERLEETQQEPLDLASPSIVGGIVGDWRGFRGIVEKVMTGGYTEYQQVVDDMNSQGGAGGILNGVVMVVLFAGIVTKGIWNFADPFIENLERLARRQARPTMLTGQELSLAWNRFESSRTEIVDDLRSLGYSEQRILWILSLAKQIVSEDEIKQLWFRQEIDDNERDLLLSKVGVIGEDKDLKTKLWFARPPVQDIIRMAVRDVFDEDVVREFGLFEQMPEAYIDEAQKSGLSRKWAELYWGSHWAMPSILQGYEMFHREVIDREQLEVLFKALDIAPGWRENLLDISYRQITRVDVRRMHDMGFLDFEELVTRYKHIGYAPDDARLMALWTEAYNARGGDEGEQQTRQLTRSLIVRGFRTNMIDRTQAVQQLVDMGYSRANAEFILDLEIANQQADAIPDRLKDNYRRIERLTQKGYLNGILNESEAIQQLLDIGYTNDEAVAELRHIELERSLSVRQMLVDAIKERYTTFQLNVNETRELMTIRGFTQNEIDILIGQWNILRLNRSRLPTKTDIKNWLKAGVIERGRAFNFLRGMGYPDNVVELYMADFTSEA